MRKVCLAAAAIAAARLAAACAAAVALWGGQAAAAVQTIPFTVNPGDWQGSPAPFGLPANPTLIGSVSIDDTLTGASAFTAISYATGTKTWSVASLLAAPSFVTYSAPGVISEFFFYLMDADGSAYVGANNTAVIFDGASAISCVGCVASPITRPFVHAVVPEPATWALMIAGLGLTGAALRRRRSYAKAA